MNDKVTSSPQLALMPHGNDYSPDYTFEGFGGQDELLPILLFGDDDIDEEDLDEDESFDDMDDDFDDEDDFEDDDYEDEDDDYDYEEDVDYDDFDE